jgi:hypothetical protein
LRSGLDFVLRHVGRDAVPAARRLAADPTRPAAARCYALIVLGRLGAAGDLPGLTPFLTDRTSVFDWKSDGPAGRVSYSAQVRDVAAFVGLKLSGRDPAAFGFPPRHDGPWFLTFGFADDAAREAAHAKAKAVLAANPPAPADDPTALVAQLGSPRFEDREAAEKALRAMGLTAKPAVKAALKNSDPEVAKRAATVLDVIRKEQFWPRFSKLLGDDADAKALFDAIRSVPRNVELIEAAEEKTEDVSKLYADRRAELNERCTNRSDPKRLVFHPTRVSAAEMAGFLYLGTFPGAADGKYARGGAENHFVMFFRDMWQNTAYPFSAALTKGPLKAGCGRLLVKWTETRADPRELERGLNGAIAFGLADVVPFAKAYARNVTADKPKYLPEPLLLALSAVGKLGAKDDLPLLIGFADDRTVVRRTFMTYPGDEKNPPQEFRPGKDYSLELRDAAVVAALVLCGQSRERIDEYGFFVSRYEPRLTGNPLPPVGKRRYADDPLTPGDLGFVHDEDREAAHKKARAWLATNAPPPPKEKDAKPADDPADLVRQLGSPAFADREAAEQKLRSLGAKAKPAVLAGLASPDPEIARRCAAVRDHIRRDSLWPRFAELVGDDAAGRDLFAAIVGSRRNAEVLEQAADDPAAAGKLYLARRTEIIAATRVELGPGHYTHKPPAAADVYGFLYLGTWPGTGLAREQSERLAFLPEPGEWKRSGAEIAKALAPGSPLAAPLRRLVVRWGEHRVEDDGLRTALGFALEYDAKELTALARRVLGWAKEANEKNPKPLNEPVSTMNRALALCVLGKHGTAADVPLVRAFADDAGRALAIIQEDENNRRPGYALPIDGKDVTVRVGDVAVAMLVRLHGGDPKAFGFYWPAGKGLKVPDPFRPSVIGFIAEADRTAAHAKAKAWLAGQRK